MDLTKLDSFSSRELEQFKSVCSRLLGNTFLVRSLYQPGGGTTVNPEYSFLVRNQDVVRDYLSLLDWELHQDEYHGYFYVWNTLEANRCTLNKNTTCILLVLRLIYDEDSERAGLFSDVLCHVRELLDKLVTVFGIFRQKPNMDEIRKSLKQLEKYHIVQCVEGKFSEVSCTFTILPTIMTAVSTEKMNTLVAELQREEAPEADEEAEESPAD